jgi:hypothetical protein
MACHTFWWLARSISCATHRSPSSSTRYVTRARLVTWESRKSIRRPGVAITISTPRRNAAACKRWPKHKRRLSRSCSKQATARDNMKLQCIPQWPRLRQRWRACCLHVLHPHTNGCLRAKQMDFWRRLNCGRPGCASLTPCWSSAWHRPKLLPAALELHRRTQRRS